MDGASGIMGIYLPWFWTKMTENSLGTFFFVVFDMLLDTC
ncbi:hypothetical protein P872_11965 [Rhodonellum psychrophilum GCM71 = DSM 17998]|uniref:Uncharacterized protein n=1 Tax=Rhodonellum psychrophilum GCM71 = DSM 17998 TaxID=1123057 RepID=U5BWL3_9BACT|nr:hypothetical protein P872_11965 [Rhodonellum psychrophilum GCM71 = DSM 17998]